MNPDDYADYEAVRSYSLANGTFTVTYESGAECVHNAAIVYSRFADGVLDTLVYGHSDRKLVAVNLITVNGKTIARITN